MKVGWHAAAQFLCLAGALLIILLSPVAAQDIRGMERCTAETRMERRTGCLQANVEFLQQALIKLAHETQEKITATDRDLASARAEIAARCPSLAQSRPAEMSAQCPPSKDMTTVTAGQKMSFGLHDVQA